MAKLTKPVVLPADARQKRVVILGLPPVDALDVIGPAEVFAWANQMADGGMAPYVLELVCSSPDVHLESETGIGLKGHSTLEQECRSNKPIDTLLVTAGAMTFEQIDRVAIDWLRMRSPTVRRVCSICVGAFALAAAGLLDGRSATTHWGVARRLAERYPKVKVDPTPIWIKDGNVYTSAGISSGIDLALSLVAEDLGNDLALEIAKNLVLFLRRPGGQAQFSFALQSQRAHDSSLNELCLWISEHLHMELTVEIMAARTSTSVRTLIRMFQRELQTTPAKYVENVRLEAVCRSLAFGEKSMHDICRRNGYHSAEVLRKAFTRHFGITPLEYAHRFDKSPEPTQP
ncbi:transcriptional regulator containing an amidase domain and an AraC-type DNA-binding HTH domain [Pseudomonas sp. GM18]|uniref:GlxA family transcriptional regulator n=1 Tax=Pseudomonas sp. GM18 TaxID=1144324 RepID=UPI00027265A5|nr:helix-turn-helix domain-containing protein [Pseudomonas sp. GM18]EJM21791.1 transcriptional regulator containing an amidase domain and an AraC-type DNA-binding HTH domain [Pseudomonas sp. GM18]